MPRLYEPAHTATLERFFQAQRDKVSGLATQSLRRCRLRLRQLSDDTAALEWELRGRGFGGLPRGKGQS